MKKDILKDLGNWKIHSDNNALFVKGKAIWLKNVDKGWDTKEEKDKVRIYSYRLLIP